MATFSIANLKDLDTFAAILASGLENAPFPLLLLNGPPGAGKTAFVSALLRHLPNSENCECGSPSFNLCNLYPTWPPIAHFDLYRHPGQIPEELLEYLEDEQTLTIVEWGSYLPAELRPAYWLDIDFNLNNNARLLHIASDNPAGKQLAARLVAAWRESLKNCSH